MNRRLVPTARPARRRAWTAPVLLCVAAASASGADAPPPSPPAPPPVEALPDVLVQDSLRTPVLGASPVGPVSVLESVQPVGTLSGARLRERAAGSLGATLAAEPGVSSSGFAPGAGRPVLRGVGGDRIRVIENGVGTLDVAGISDDHAVPIDAASVDSLEILHGPSTLRYGANAIGGTVVAHDGRIPRRAVGRRLTGRVGGAYGSADDERSGALALAGQIECFSWRLAAFARETADLDVPGLAKSRRLLEEEGNPSGAGEARDTLPNSWAKASGGSVGGAQTTDSGFAGASISWFDTEYGLPNEADVRIDLSRLRLDVAGRRDAPFAGFRSISWDLAFVDYEHTEHEDEEAGTVFRQQAFEGRVELAHDPWGCVTGAFGVMGSYADLEVVGEEALLPRARTTTLAAFATERVPLSACLELEVGLRCDVTDLDATARETFVAPSASAGLRLRTSPSTVFALSIAYASRAPTAFELYADGAHVATGAYEVGDPDLRLERSLGADLSFRTDGPRVSASTTVFAQRYLNFLALVPTGATDLGSGLPVFAYREHDAALLGAEAKVVFHLSCDPCRALDLELVADAVRAENLDLDEPLPRVPPFRFGGGLVYRTPTFSARVDVQHALEQDRVAAFERRTDGWTRLDASVSKSIDLAWGTTATLRLTATNLLDEEIRHHTSFTKDVAPERGRSLRIGLELDF